MKPPHEASGSPAPGEARTYNDLVPIDGRHTGGYGPQSLTGRVKLALILPRAIEETWPLSRLARECGFSEASAGRVVRGAAASLARMPVSLLLGTASQATAAIRAVLGADVALLHRWAEERGRGEDFTPEQEERHHRAWERVLAALPAIEGKASEPAGVAAAEAPPAVAVVRTRF